MSDTLEKLHFIAIFKELNHLSERATGLLSSYQKLDKKLATAVDESASNASESAQSKDQAEQILADINTLNSELNVKIEQATSALETAERIVYGGDFSVTPAAGIAPITGENGVLDEGFLPGDWGALEEALALSISNSTQSLKQLSEFLKHKKETSAFSKKTTKKLDVTASKLSLLAIAFNKEVSKNDILNAKIKDIVMLLAWNAESEAAFRRTQGQTGLTGVRQYVYHNDWQPHSENGQPAHMHNHPQYRYLVGSGEVEGVVNGYLFKSRHRDFMLKKARQSGSPFLSTETIPAPALPASVSGTIEQQTEAMRSLFYRYQNGEFPEGFGWSLAMLEFWFAPFSEDVLDAYESQRHQQELSSVNSVLRNLIRYSASGGRNLRENMALELPICKWVDANGNAVIGILKHRMICADVSQFGDLRPSLEKIEDPIFSVAGRTSNRYLLKENNNAPGILDDLMKSVAGLNGYGANLREEYPESNNANYYIQDYWTGETLNAAYYTRFARVADDDASNRVKFKRGLNDPYLFTAANTQRGVLNKTIGSQSYRESYAIPLELILRTPLENWNPYDVSISTGEEITGDGSEASPYSANAENKYWYRTPAGFFTGSSSADQADTVSGSKWVSTPTGVKEMVQSGIWVKLPKINGVDSKVRQRYAIFPDYNDGSKAFRHASATAALNLSLSICNATESLTLHKKINDIERKQSNEIKQVTESLMLHKKN